jgi:hypothetical protein
VLILHNISYESIWLLIHCKELLFFLTWGCLWYVALARYIVFSQLVIPRLSWDNNVSRTALWISPLIMAATLWFSVLQFSATNPPEFSIVSTRNPNLIADFGFNKEDQVFVVCNYKHRGLDILHVVVHVDNQLFL